MAAKSATARRYKGTYTLYVTCTAMNKRYHGLQGSPLSCPWWTESAAALQSQRQRRHVHSDHTVVVESKRIVFTPSTPYKEHETRRGGDGGATDIDGHGEAASLAKLRRWRAVENDFRLACGPRGEANALARCTRYWWSC
jgi:hypothetical protein